MLDACLLHSPVQSYFNRVANIAMFTLKATWQLWRQRTSKWVAMSASRKLSFACIHSTEEIVRDLVIFLVTVDILALLFRFTRLLISFRLRFRPLGLGFAKKFDFNA
jgi:hypothetical protein